MALHLALLIQETAGRVDPAYERNFAYLFYGLLVTWLILFAYLVWIAARERRITSELKRLKVMVEDREKERE
ncbi:MAG TPA: CcmD family protein [Bryobacteraceae bacterium]|nr:CcmD family protein [Bryobacteraceae bacterium]